MNSAAYAPHPEADVTERLLMEGLSRLASGNPNDEGLKAKLAKGRMIVTKLSLAKETGLDRRLFTGDECRYGRVAAAIVEAQGRIVASTGRGAPGPEIDLREKNAALEIEVAELKSALKASRQTSSVAYAVSAATQIVLQEVLRDKERTAPTDEQRTAARRKAETLLARRE